MRGLWGCIHKVEAPLSERFMGMYTYSRDSSK